MATEIVVALITLAGSALGTFGGIIINHCLTVYRIKQLEKKVDMHNQVIERTYKLEENTKENSHDIVELKSDVRDIKKHLMKG